MNLSRGTSSVLCALVDEVAFDHQDRHAFVLLRRGETPSKASPRRFTGRPIAA